MNCLFKDGIFKMSLSPNKDILVAIHHSGRLSLWDVPSLRCRKTWSHEQQIGGDEINPVIAEDPRRRKQFKGQDFRYPPFCQIHDALWVIYRYANVLDIILTKLRNLFLADLCTFDVS